MVQFPNQITQAIIIRDSNGIIVVQIGPGPSIQVTDPNHPLSQIKIFPTGTGQPVIDLIDKEGGTYNILAQDIGAGANREWLEIGPDIGTKIRLFLNSIGLGFDSGDGNIGVLFDWKDGLFKYSQTISQGTVVGWTDAILQNSWTNLGGNFANVGWRVTPDGLVILRGVCVNGTNANGTVVFTLPSGAHPVQAQESLIKNGTNSASYFQLQTNGDVQLFNAVGATSLSLDGAHFWLVS